MPPRENIKFIAGLLALVLVLGCSHYLDSAPSDMQSEEDSAANFRDALAQAQAKRPDLWNAERRARADRAAVLAARQVQP